MYMYECDPNNSTYMRAINRLVHQMNISECQRLGLCMPICVVFLHYPKI